jgi:NAD(P)-dependent dehydrogenase (short-subunit alcohol dehydrogenase family)
MQKQVLITGVSGGIGKVLSSMFREQNYYVYGLDLQEDYQVHCDRFIQFDIDRYVREADYRVRFSSLFAELIPRLDVLINNAAVQKLDKLEHVKLDEWQETLNVNLTGPMLLSKLFLKRLEESQGAIINIASIHHEQTKPRFVSYATSKSALVGLTRALAVDLGGRVRVNCISPAAVETSMLRAGFNNSEKALDELRAIHPVGRIGQPEDVAKLALFLAEDVNGFLHGANISLDGGIASVLKDL